MGLFFDSFDNDNQKNNPYVALMMNDGTRSYDHQTDGAQQMLSGSSVRLYDYLERQYELTKTPNISYVI